MPERSYEKYSISKSFKYPNKNEKFLNDPEINNKLLTKQFQTYLNKHNYKYNHFIERPSKYDKKERFLPELLNFKAPFIVRRSEYDNFCLPKHNTFIYESKYRIKK